MNFWKMVETLCSRIYVDSHFADVSGSGFLISGLSHRADITNKRPSFILVDGQLVSFGFLVRHLSMVLGAWSVLFTFYIKIQWIHFPSGSNLFLASG